MDKNMRLILDSFYLMVDLMARVQIQKDTLIKSDPYTEKLLRVTDKAIQRYERRRRLETPDFRF